MKPEDTILRLLESQLREARVLDIGVGGGRTTSALSATAREYVGIDYSGSMIAVCRRKFHGVSKPLSFLVSDVRGMHQFADHSFDVVMFSYNGLDCMPHEDRLVALREIRRVCRPGGSFVFSSHNLQYAPRMFSYLSVFSMRAPQNLFRGILATSRLRALNPGFRFLLRGEHAILNDGVHKARLHMYYVKPRYQIDQLCAAGFAHVRIFSLDGMEIDSITQLGRNSDPWLYYLCA